MKSLFAALTLSALICCPIVAAEPATKDEAPKALAFKMKNLEGKEVKLSDYKGKVVLIVNVASKCGLTDSNYKGLQQLHEKYAEKGLAIVAFPCNQFGGQEPGSASDISTFCTDKYGVEFDLFSKVDVNGDKACDLYKHLTALDLKPTGKGKVSWNFEKFLLDRSGKPVARFQPRTKPTSEDVTTAIEELLAKKS
jgi:glutathione peroxidase